jgi:hypothetical protein
MDFQQAAIGEHPKRYLADRQIENLITQTE